MKFDKALSLMREGKEVRHDGQTFFMDSKFIYKKVLTNHVGPALMIWSPKQSEVMSDKWEEVQTTVINEPNRWRP